MYMYLGPDGPFNPAKPRLIFLKTRGGAVATFQELIR